MKLGTKFFTTILLVNIALAVGLYYFLQANFEESFTQYVSQRERAMAETLAVNLEGFYQENGSWDVFRAEPQLWLSFAREFGRARRREAPDIEDLPRRFGQNFRSGRTPPSPLRLFLLDADRNFVAGLRWPEQESHLRPLQIEDGIIGYLGIPIHPEMRDYLDREFASDQSRNLIVIIASVFLVALIIAIPLSYLLVQRIRSLVAFVRQLSQGHYVGSIALQGNDELTVLSQHLSELGATLSKVEQQRKQWVADISHELRTPLAILRADIEAMEDGVRQLDEPALARLQQQVMRLNRLVNDLHDLSLTDLGSLSYRKAHCDFAAIVAKSVGEMTPQFTQRGLALDFENSYSELEALPVFGDEQRLTQVIHNLLQNSLNYTDVPGQVSVRVSRSGPQVRLEIDDSAPGVEELMRPKLTQRLFRVEASRNRHSGGAGLGLTLCANIIAAHGGSITFDSSELGGLKVTVTLPLQSPA